MAPIIEIIPSGWLATPCREGDHNECIDGDCACRCHELAPGQEV